MKIRVSILPEKTVTEKEIPEKAKVEDVIRALNLKPDAIIAMKENTPIPIDASLNEGDEVTIIKVVSGG